MFLLGINADPSRKMEDDFKHDETISVRHSYLPARSETWFTETGVVFL